MNTLFNIFHFAMCYYICRLNSQKWVKRYVHYNMRIIFQILYIFIFIFPILFFPFLNSTPLTASHKFWYFVYHYYSVRTIFNTLCDIFHDPQVLFKSCLILNIQVFLRYLIFVYNLIWFSVNTLSVFWLFMWAYIYLSECSRCTQKKFTLLLFVMMFYNIN